VNYFTARMTAQEMKNEYRNLAKKYHPDLGGDTKTMQEINSQFAYQYARTASKEAYESKTQQSPDKDYSKYQNDRYINDLEKMIAWIYDNNIDRIQSITVELIGVFIWIGGIRVEDKEVRERIKDVGFQGSWKITDEGDKAYMWKWTPEIKRFKAEDNIDTIRRNYGSQDKKRYQKQIGA
jgi:hypothetical protein